MRIFKLLALTVLAGLSLSSCSLVGPVIALVDAFPFQGKAPLTVEFDASKSQARQGSIVAYHWDFADGSTSDKAQVDHTFVKSGLYKVKLQVTDSDGHSDDATVFISATDVPVPVTLGADWRTQSFKGLETCEGPASDSAGKRWYEPGYNDVAWERFPLHDGMPFYGTNRDFFFRTPLDRVTAQMKRRLNFEMHVMHSGAIELWINGKPIPPSVFGRSESPRCHADTSNVEVRGLINDYLEVGTNTMALHLSSGPSKEAQPFLQVILWVTSK